MIKLTLEKHDGSSEVIEVDLNGMEAERLLDDLQRRFPDAVKYRGAEIGIMVKDAVVAKFIASDVKLIRYEPVEVEE